MEVMMDGVADRFNADARNWRREQSSVSRKEEGEVVVERSSSSGGGSSGGQKDLGDCWMEFREMIKRPTGFLNRPSK